MEQQLSQWWDAAVDDYRRFADLAREADRELPTRLAGWRVGHLVHHVDWAVRMQAQAVAATSGAAAHPVPDPAGLDEAVDRFQQTGRVFPLAAQTPVMLPDGTVPLAFAVALFAFEAAVHASDLSDALRGSDGPRAVDVAEHAFTHTTLSACSVVVGPMLDLLASRARATRAPEGVSIDVLGLGEGVRVRVREGTWQVMAPDTEPSTCTLKGTPEQVVLFLTGRIDADNLVVEGDQNLAARFKDWFPGP